MLNHTICMYLDPETPSRLPVQHLYQPFISSVSAEPPATLAYLADPPATLAYLAVSATLAYPAVSACMPSLV